MNGSIRQAQKDHTRETILQSAYTLFSQQGIRNTRMSDIAGAAGVSHGTVFLHFKTQESLVTEVVKTYCGKIALRTHELADSSDSLQKLLRAHLDGIMEFEPFYARLVVENRLLPPGVRETWIHLQSAISFHFSQTIRRDVRFQHDDVALDVLFNMWIGLIHHYLANGDLFAPEGNVIRRYGQALIENYLKIVQCSQK